MDPSPLWSVLFVAGSLLLPPAAARPPIRGASAIAIEFDVTENPGRWEVLRDALLAPSVTDMDGQASLDRYKVTGRAATSAPAWSGTVAGREMFDGTSQPGIDVAGAQHENLPEQRAQPSAPRSVHASAMSGTCCARDPAPVEPLGQESPASGGDLRAPTRDRFASVRWPAANRDVRADEATCTAVGAASGIGLALRLVAQQFGAPVAQLLDEYQAYRPGWQGRD
jgi:hypothetical protein